MPNIGFKKYFIGIAIISLGLFLTDFVASGYYGKLGSGEGGEEASVLSVNISDMEEGEDVDTDNDGEIEDNDGGVLDETYEEGDDAAGETGEEDSEIEDEDPEDGVVAIGVGDNNLMENDLITSEVLEKAGLEGARVEDIKYTEKLFDYFELEETKGNPMLKKVIYDDKDRAIAFIYKFPSGSYALGANYKSIIEQVKTNITGNYKLYEPSSFGPRSFYIASSDPNEPSITAFAQINKTLVGFEYTRGMYPTMQKIIDVIISN